MARIRSIKPEFWASPQIMALTHSARLLFIGSWNWCDDAGNHPYDPMRLKAQVFPGDDVASESVRGMLQELSTNGLVEVYEVDSRRYFHITGWNHQRIDKPQAPRFPGPTQECSKSAPRIEQTTPIPRMVVERSTPDVDVERKGKEEIRKEKNQNPTTSAEVAAPHVRARAEKRDDDKPETQEWRDLRVALCEIYTNAGIIDQPDTGRLATWRVIEDWKPAWCKAVVESGISSLVRKGDKTWKPLKYFENSIREHHERKNNPSPGASPAEVASAPAAPVECEDMKPFSVEYSQKALELFEKGAMFWPPQIGARPDQRGCKVPLDILRARGYRDEHNRVVPLNDTVAGKRYVAAMQARQAMIEAANGAIRDPAAPKRSLAPRLKAVPPGETIQ